MDSIPEIHQAFDIADRVNLSPEEIANIERQEMFIYDQQGTIIKAVKESNMTIARQLLDRLDDATIAQITGLSVQDVQNLRSQV